MSKNLQTRIDTLMNERCETSLEYELASTAAWRIEKAELYPEDKRNQEAVEILTKLAEEVAKLGPAHPLVKRFDQLWMDHEEEGGRFSEIRQEVLRGIGFRSEPKTGEAFVVDLIDGYERHLAEVDLAAVNEVVKLSQYATKPDDVEVVKLSQYATKPKVKPVHLKLVSEPKEDE